MNVKQVRAKRLNMAERAEQQMQLLFSDIHTAWIWKRKINHGYTTIPRTMPLVMQVIDNLTKGSPAGHTLLCLWMRAPDHPMLVIENPSTFAAEAGFVGQRAVDTWRKRMKHLAELQFIRAKKGPSGDYHYVLLLNPNAIVALLNRQQKVQTELYGRFITRVDEVGATSELDPIRAAWAEEDRQKAILEAEAKAKAEAEAAAAASNHAQLPLLMSTSEASKDKSVVREPVEQVADGQQINDKGKGALKTPARSRKKSGA
jgi:hypothetical protein